MTDDAPIDPIEVDRGSLLAPATSSIDGPTPPDGEELAASDCTAESVTEPAIPTAASELQDLPPTTVETVLPQGHSAVEPDANADAAVENWVMPRDLEVTFVDEGPYAGRPIVGKAGSMTHIVPTILPTQVGGHRPDATVDAGFISEDVYVGAVSLRGPGHHHMAMARQDQYAVGVEGDWFIGVVADGVSQGKYLSHLAADRAALTALNEVRKRIKATGSCDEWDEVAEACRNQVRRLAERTLEGRWRDPSSDEQVDVATASDAALAKGMSTTCDVVVCKLSPDDNGDRGVVRATIAGDGCAYRLDPRRGWLQIGTGKVETSGLASNSVVPLPVDPGPPRVTTTRLARGEALVLCTDGFGELIDEGLRPVAQYLFREWAQPLDTVGLLRTASFVNINGGDDRTAIIVWAVK